MHRCFLPVPDFPTGALLHVQGEEAHHALRVLRLRVGDECELFNGLGQAALARIEQAGSNELGTRVTCPLPPLPNMARITLAVAVPKGANMELIVQKAVEMGVQRIIPLITERTIVRLSPSDAAAKAKKWARTALEACKQCGVNTLPRIENPMPYADLLRQQDLPTLRLQCAILPDSRPLREVLEHARSQGIEEVLLLIGPEGDFSPSEYEQGRAAGYIPVSLGPIILRVESAVFVATAAARYALDPT